MGRELSILISSVYSISRFFKEQLKSPVAFQGFFLKVYIEPVKGVLRPGCLGASEATFPAVPRCHEALWEGGGSSW